MANPDFSANFGPVEYDHYPNANAASQSVQGLKEKIKGKEERIALLKEIKKDGEERLEAQRRDIAKRDKEIKKMEKVFERQLASNAKTLGDAGLRLQFTDKKIISLNEQHCRGIMEVQNYQKNKHRIEAQARREVREEMRLERKQRAEIAAVRTEQMQAVKSQREKRALEQQKRMVGRNANGSESNDTGRRTPMASGSFFSRVSIGGGSGNGTANGGRAGR